MVHGTLDVWSIPLNFICYFHSRMKSLNGGTENDRFPLARPSVWHVVDTQKTVDEWMNEQIDKAILIYLKQVLCDIFNFLGFDSFQNICSKISFPLKHDFPL